MKRLAQFSVIELLLIASVCAMFLAANLSPRVSEDEWQFATPLLMQTMERGWPKSYQFETEHNQLSMEGTERENLRAGFLVQNPVRITHLDGLCVNSVVLFTMLATIHVAFTFYGGIYPERE